MKYLGIMFLALIGTIVIEGTLAYVMGVRSKNDFINVILVNIMTNPMVNAISFYFNVRYGLLSRRIAIVILEILAFLIEGFIYSKVLDYKKKNGYLLSFILNLASYSIGILINCLI